MFARPSQNLHQSKLSIEDLSEPRVWEESAPASESVDKRRREALRSVADHDWITAVLCMVCDIVYWVVLYGIVGYVRRDQFFVSPFEFLLVDCVVLAVILQALYIIGAYNQSPKQQQLEFVDNDVARVGSAIADEGSPIIQGGIAARLAQLDGRYSGVILAQSIDRLSRELLDLLVRTQFQRTRVYTLESFHEVHWRHVPMHTIDPFWPLQMGFQLARISPYHYLKRLFDLIFSAVLLLISAPLVALIVLLIWTESGRPAIFRQLRVGCEGQIFTAYKFRTMFMPDLTEQTTDLYTRKDDSRVTPVGRLLRKLRIDELPQLWNVFKGDMSLIGPRAEWTRCAERYEQIIPFYHFRHLVKPGITGWAQVNYPYGESDEDTVEKLQYDLYYIRHYSLKLDAMIVLKTVHTMLFGKGR